VAAKVSQASFSGGRKGEGAVLSLGSHTLRRVRKLSLQVQVEGCSKTVAVPVFK